MISENVVCCVFEEYSFTKSCFFLFFCFCVSVGPFSFPATFEGLNQQIDADLFMSNFCSHLGVWNLWSFGEVMAF